MDLIRDLYSLSKDNKNFINARFLEKEDTLEPYKKIIERSLYPDFDRPIRISVGKKAVSDLRKATDDPISILELMIYYVECGTQCTLDYGDIDEHFYYSLELMFDDILNILVKSDQEIIDTFLPRLRAVVQKAEGIGWGYYDYISDILEDAFPERA